MTMQSDVQLPGDVPSESYDYTDSLENDEGDFPASSDGLWLDCLEPGEVVRQSEPAMTFEDAVKLIRMDESQFHGQDSDAKDLEFSILDNPEEIRKIAYDLMFPILYSSGDDIETVNPSVFQIPRFVEPFWGAGFDVMLDRHARPNGRNLERIELAAGPSQRIPEGTDLTSPPKSIRFISLKKADECIVDANWSGERAFYEKGGRLFWIQTSHRAWIPVDTSSVKRHLKAWKFIHFHHPVQLSPQEQELNRIQTDCAVDYVGGVAGYRKGLRRICSHDVLVTSEPLLLAPTEGDFPLIRRFLEGLLNEPDDGIDQRDHLYCWLKTSLQSLYAGEASLGPAMILVGPAHAGKSYLQTIITMMMGGRSANPYQYMTGQTPFNSELFQAEHLSIEDQMAPGRASEQVFFTQKFKEFCVNERRSCHRKGREQITLCSYCRVTVSVNEEPHCLETLPRLMEDVKDKLMILRAGHRRIPVRKKDESIASFHNAVRKELPCFIEHLLYHYSIPDHLREPRFGFSMFHHPEVLIKMNSSKPEFKLLQLIDRQLFKPEEGGVPAKDPWIGRASELEFKLMTPGTSTSYEARALFTSPNACGYLLSLLEKLKPEQFTSRMVDKYKQWKISPAVAGRAAGTAQASGTGKENVGGEGG